MRFSTWARLADEYAMIYWQWATPLYDMAQAYKAYLNGATPRDYIDKVAMQIDLKSYPDTHEGKLPDGFEMSRYTDN